MPTPKETAWARAFESTILQPAAAPYCGHSVFEFSTEPCWQVSRPTLGSQNITVKNYFENRPVAARYAATRPYTRPTCDLAPGKAGRPLSAVIQGGHGIFLSAVGLNRHSGTAITSRKHRSRPKRWGPWPGETQLGCSSSASAFPQELSSA